MDRAATPNRTVWAFEGVQRCRQHARTACGGLQGGKFSRRWCRAVDIRRYPRKSPAWSTQPRMTSPISGGGTFARAIASRTATAPRSTADRFLNAPPNAPMEVRHALRMTASDCLATGLHISPILAADFVERV